jgi:hypothetical protein
MKPRTLSHIFIIFALLAGLALSSQRVLAEDYYPEAVYSHEELSQMLAPIALYPDALLSQVLMASTYPIEVIEADRWLRANTHLQGAALDAALAGVDWDPSVKALCHFPSILALMSERIGETTDLGNAFLAQEDEVMGTVQELRAAAYAQGNLYTNAQQRVIVEPETIVIEPTTQFIYVPYYDPFTIYGPWWYPAYPPWYWSPSGVHIGFGIAYWPGIHFSFSFVSWSRFDWHRRQIHIDVHKRPRYVRDDHWAKPGRWQHAPAHRRGVAYRDRPTAVKYGQPQPRVRFRPDDRHITRRRELNLHRQTGNPGRHNLQQKGEKIRPPSDRRKQLRVEKPKSSPEKHVWTTFDRTRPKAIKGASNRSVEKPSGNQKQQKPIKRQVRPNRENNRARVVRQAPGTGRTEPAVRNQTPSERQPVAVNGPKRQTTVRENRSRTERRQLQDARDNSGSRRGAARGDLNLSEGARAEKHDWKNGSKGWDRAAGENRGNRFDRSRNGR